MLDAAVRRQERRAVVLDTMVMQTSRSRAGAWEGSVRRHGQRKPGRNGIGSGP